jgi:hypothetical protein
MVLDVRQGHEPRDNLALGWKMLHVQGMREYRGGTALNIIRYFDVAIASCRL